MTRETVVRAAAPAWSVFAGESKTQGIFLQTELHAPVCPIILDAMREAGSGNQLSYGHDCVTAAMQARLSDLFETEVSIWFTSGATAAGALTISAFCRPTSTVICSGTSFLVRDGRGAIPFFCGGAQICPLPTTHGKIAPAALTEILHQTDRMDPHHAPPDLLSLSNLTEAGTTYTPSEVAELAGIARQAGLAVHMDGRRFASSIASKGAAPADLTWRAGIDALSFGATRNGAMDCEAIILFGKARGRWHDLVAKATRAGHAPAKMRYFAVQMEALLRYDLWLDLARASNISARHVATVLSNVPGAKIIHPVDGNMVFAYLPETAINALQASGCWFQLRGGGVCRFVCSAATSKAEIRELARVLAVAKPSYTPRIFPALEGN